MVKVNANRYDKGMVHATLSIILANTIFLLLNLIKGITLAKYIGAGADMDIFLAVDSIPTILVSLFSGALLASIVPELIKIRDPDDEFRFCNSLITITIIFAVIVVLILIFLSRPVITLLYSLEKINLAVQLSYLIFPFICTGLIFNVLKSIANTHKIFFIPALSSSLYILSIISCVILLQPSFGVLALGLGVLAGSCLQLILVFIQLRSHGFRFKFHIDFRNPHLIRTMKMTTPLIIGSALVTLNVFVDRIMASRIGTGYIATLHYGYIPLTFILSFFTVGLSTSILPYLSNHVVKNNIYKIKRLFNQAIRLVFFITLPAVVLCLFVANPFIELLLERGAFTSDNTSSVALVLRFYALGLPFAAINATIIRFFHALQKNNILMYISIPYVGLNIVLNWILIHPLGHGGIALSTAIDYLLVVFVLYIILNRILGSLIEKQDIVVIMKTITATILMTISLFVYTKTVQEAHIISQLIQPCVLAVTVYVTTSVLMKHQDFHYLKGAVTKIFQRNATR